MTAGAVLGAVLLAAFSQVTTLPALYVVWVGLGAVMAMVLYEPAFVLVANTFGRRRDRALTVLTLFGGLASTLIVPVATWLLELRGWRGAALALAGLLAATTVPLHWLALRRPPARPGAPPAPATHDAVRSVPAGSSFWSLTAAFSLAGMVGVATSVHLIPFLVGRGVSPVTAATTLGLVGLMQLPGRLAFGLLPRLPWEAAAAAIFLMQAAAVVLLASTTTGPALAAFACLFGAGNGMATLLRASTLAEMSGAARYGRVSGAASLVTTAGRAAGPVLASLAVAATGGYERALTLLAAILGIAAALALRGPLYLRDSPRDASAAVM
jgi:predicted MFS family arabinose efflux permease